MGKYKINIHSHTIFSDGVNSPYLMAVKAKELGFTALVITDHYYTDDEQFLLNKDRMALLKASAREARKVLPIIIGMEVPLAGQEVLLFGGAAIKWVLHNGEPTTRDIAKLKRETGCALVLCHPGNNFLEAATVVDGFERYNSGRDFFRNDRELKNLKGKQQWCNSDAHNANSLDICYNIVDSKIYNESDLIKYIKRGRQHEFYLKESTQVY